MSRRDYLMGYNFPVNSGRYRRGTFRRFTAGMFAMRKGVRSEASQGRSAGARRGRTHFQQKMMCDGEKFYSRGASPIATTAALSVAILLAVIGSYIGDLMKESPTPPPDTRQPSLMPRYAEIEDSNNNGIPDWQDELVRTGVSISAGTSTASTTLSNDPAATLGDSLLSSLVSGYNSLKQYDSYSQEQGKVLATTLAENFKAPNTALLHAKTELTLDADVSQTRILKYRSDMREALAGLVDLEAEPEFSLFARFIQTNDAKWLNELTKAAGRYRTAEANLVNVTVPYSAVDIHLRAVNAVASYAETLERLVRFGRDPLASMALLRTYNDTEREFLLAFDALAKFYVEDVSGN